MNEFKPRCVIFDADGVIFDCIDTHEEIRRELAPIFGLAANQLDHKGAEALRTLRTIFDEHAVQFYLSLWDKKEIEKGLKPVTGVNEVFNFLKSQGVKIGMLTNRVTRLGVLNTFRASGVDFSKLDFFINHDPKPALTKLKFMFGVLEKLHANHFLNIHPKPDAKAVLPALSILKRLPRFPKSVYYVGDNLIDLEFARANGFGFVGVLNGAIKDRNEWRDAGVEIVIRDISEIPKILRT